MEVSLKSLGAALFLQHLNLEHYKRELRITLCQPHNSAYRVVSHVKYQSLQCPCNTP